MPQPAITLRSELAGAARLAVLAVGSDLRGDDAAGLLVAGELLKCLDFPQNASVKPRLRVFVGHTAPENLTGEIKQYAPDHVVIVDAAVMGKPPGQVAVLHETDLGDAASVSTHGMPLNVLAKYLHHYVACRLTFLAVQPESTDWGRAPSEAVIAAAATLAAAIVEALR